MKASRISASVILPPPKSYRSRLKAVPRGTRPCRTNRIKLSGCLIRGKAAAPAICSVSVAFDQATNGSGPAAHVRPHDRHGRAGDFANISTGSTANGDLRKHVGNRVEISKETPRATSRTPERRFIPEDTDGAS